MIQLFLWVARMFHWRVSFSSRNPVHLLVLRNGDAWLC
uniref:Uncharacterized protein n=1 Tax=Lotus japonicus TaxID=34305 RepID=I3SIF3_LOTJA|nr:unknown [Lotus japonicus]